MAIQTIGAVTDSCWLSHCSAVADKCQILSNSSTSISRSRNPVVGSTAVYPGKHHNRQAKVGNASTTKTNKDLTTTPNLRYE